MCSSTSVLIFGQQMNRIFDHTPTNIIALNSRLQRVLLWLAQSNYMCHFLCIVVIREIREIERLKTILIGKFAHRF